VALPPLQGFLELLEKNWRDKGFVVVPTAVDSNIAVVRGKLCVQTCEVDTHQLPADIDMHILAYTHQLRVPVVQPLTAKLDTKKLDDLYGSFSVVTDSVFDLHFVFLLNEEF
jgi:hypothetical protein